jgi:hypothetical protein
MYTYFKKLAKLKTTAETIKIAAATFELYVWHAERKKKLLKKKQLKTAYFQRTVVFSKRKEGRKERKKERKKEGKKEGIVF